MVSELELACSLANPIIRHYVRPLLGSVDLKSDLAKSIADFITKATYTPTIAEIRIHLSKEVSEDQVNKIEDIIRAYLLLNRRASEVIVQLFKKIYYDTEVSKAMSSSRGDSQKLIRMIKSIKDSEDTTIPIERVGEMDVDDIISSEVGDLEGLPSKFEFVKNSTPWGGYLRGQVVEVCAPPGTGKSLFLANETLEFLKRGRKVLWISLGDMFKMDFITRFSSLIKKSDYFQVSMAPKQFFDLGVRDILNNLRVAVLPAGVIDAYELRDLVENRVAEEEDFDVLVVDYDSNIAKSSDSMFEQGDIVYNMLTSLARPIGRQYRLVMVASQPKIQYWREIELPKEAPGESSRKQAIVDMLITLGRNYKVKDCHVGVMRIAKVRRGNEGSKSYFRVSEYGDFLEIPASEYSLLQTHSSEEFGIKPSSRPYENAFGSNNGNKD